MSRSSKMSRRAFVEFAGTSALGGVLLASCTTTPAQPTSAPTQVPAQTAGPTAAPPTSSPATVAPPAEKTRIEMWFPFSLEVEEGAKPHAFAALTTEFNEKMPDVEVEVFAANWNMEKLVASVVGGTPPDVFYMDRYIGGEWAARKILEPLDDLYAASQVVHTSDIWPELLKDVVYQGKTYGAPQYTDVRAYYWNKDIFKELGLPEDQQPATWEEQNAYIEKIFKVDDQGEIDRLGFCAAYGNPPPWAVWYIYLWQLGGEFMNADKTKVTFNNEAGVGAMQYLLDVFELQGGIDKVEKFASALAPGPGQDIFMMGKMGMEIHGDWLPSHWEKYAPDLRWGIGYIPIPEGGQKANYHGGHAWVEPKGCKHREAAWKYIEWMLSEDCQLRASLQEGIIPARQALAESSRYLDGEPKERSELRKLFVDEFRHAKWVPTIPGVGEILAANQRAYDECMRKVKTPKEAIDAFAAEAQKIMDDWQEKIQSQ